MSKSTAELLQARRYNPDTPPPPEQVVFRIDFQNIGSLGNFITITGLPKAGKSKFISGIIAAAIKKVDIFRLTMKLPDGKDRIGHFDTEQSLHDYYRQIELIKELSHETTLKKFDSFNTREDGPRENMQMIEFYLSANPDCGLLIIDGLLDLLLSFNDEGTSKEVINFLKRWTKEYNVLLISILHRSKTGGSSMGHLGSAADRAAQSILIVEKDKENNCYVLRPEYLRSADDFSPVAIHYNKSLEQWEETEYHEATQEGGSKKALKAMPHEYTEDAHRDEIRRIFARAPYQKYDQLLQNIIEIYAVSREWARLAIKHFIKEGWIFYTTDGYTNESQAKLFIATK